jgi:P-type E1-E2 ATPase
MQVTDVCVVAGMDRGDLVHMVGAVESASEHAIGSAVAEFARVECGTVGEVDEYLSLPGLGAQGLVDGRRVVLGSPKLFVTRNEEVPPEISAAQARWESGGHTLILAAVDGYVVGALALADTVKPTAARAVDELHALGLRCILLTGDNQGAADAVGGAIGVDEVVADSLPGEKVALIRRLQGEGRSVAFIGDGVNDGPALTVADLGLALGSGTDVAIHAADMILLSESLTAVPTAIGLARRTLRTIHGNLVWAFAYNLAAIPLAAFGLLNPLIAGASMALSSSFVVWNSSRLRKYGAMDAEVDDEATGQSVATLDSVTSAP